LQQSLREIQKLHRMRREILPDLIIPKSLRALKH